MISVLGILCLLGLHMMDGVSSSIMEVGIDVNSSVIPPLNSVSGHVERVTHHLPTDLEWENNMPIEQRIRCIQHLSTTTTHMSNCPSVTPGTNGGSEKISRDYENGKCCVDLVAKALEKETLDLKKEAKRTEKKAASYYDCNVCFELAKDPILTCCGHLFCWNCFYNVPYIDSRTKECPMCEGEVSDSTVIPIYGNNGACNEENRTPKIPPRPKARRVESVGPSSTPAYLSRASFTDALRRIALSFGNAPDDPSRHRGTGLTNVLVPQQFQSISRGRRLRQRPMRRDLLASPLSALGDFNGSGDASGLSSLDVLESDDSTDGVGVMALPVSTPSSLQPSDVSDYGHNGRASHPYNLRSRSRSASARSTFGVGNNRESNASSRRRRLN